MLLCPGLLGGNGLLLRWITRRASFSGKFLSDDAAASPAAWKWSDSQQKAGTNQHSGAHSPLARVPTTRLASAWHFSPKDDSAGDKLLTFLLSSRNSQPDGAEELFKFISQQRHLNQEESRLVLAEAFKRLIRPFSKSSLVSVAETNDIPVLAARTDSFKLYVLRALQTLASNKADIFTDSEVAAVIKLTSAAALHGTPSLSIGHALLAASDVLIGRVSHVRSPVALLSLLSVVNKFQLHDVMHGDMIKLVWTVIHSVSPKMTMLHSNLSLHDLFRLSEACELLVRLDLCVPVFLDAVAAYIERCTDVYFSTSGVVQTYPLLMLSYFKYHAPELFIEARARYENRAGMQGFAQATSGGTRQRPSALVYFNWSFVGQNLRPPVRSMHEMCTALRREESSSLQLRRHLEQLLPFAASRDEYMAMRSAIEMDSFGYVPPLDNLTVQCLQKIYPKALVNVGTPSGPVPVAALVCPQNGKILPWPGHLHPGQLTPEVVSSLPGQPVACLIVRASDMSKTSPDDYNNPGGDKRLEWNGFVDRMHFALMERGWHVTTYPLLDEISSRPRYVHALMKTVISAATWDVPAP